MPVDPIGLSLGVISLASLFTTCIECFDYIDAARSYGRDSEILACQFDVEKSRLLIWGDGIGLLLTDGRVHNTMVNSPQFQPVIERILNCIHLLLTDSDSLMSRYGLKDSQSSQVCSNPGRRVSSTSMARFRASFAEFKSHVYTSQQEISIAKSTRWAIHDRDKFRNLVDDLHRLIDGLEQITNNPDMLTRRTQMIYDEVRSQKGAELNLLVEATFTKYPDWSDAASEAVGASIIVPEDRENIYHWLETVSISDSTMPPPMPHPTVRETSDEGELVKEIPRRYKSNDIPKNMQRLFMHNVMKELTIPLDAILGMATVSIAEDDLSKMRRGLAVIYKSGDLLLHLMNDLLTFSQGESPKEVLVLEKRNFYIAEIMEQVQPIFQSPAKDRNIDLQVIAADGKRSPNPVDKDGIGRPLGNLNAKEANLAQSCLYGDNHRILQILINLVSNALKFTPVGGHVTVRFWYLDPALSDTKADSNLWDDHDESRVTLAMQVEDDGPGIPTDFQVSIFEPFNRGVYNRPGGNNIGGIGLGLSICAQLTKLMDGSISVKSDVGEGSIFTVVIPLQDGSANNQ